MGLMIVAGNSLTGATPAFLWPGGSFGDSIPISLEPFGQWVAPKTGTISRIKGKIATNTFDDTTTYTLRLNGIDTAATITIPAGSTADFTIPGSIAVAEDDLISWKIDRPSTIGGIGEVEITYDFD